MSPMIPADTATDRIQRLIAEQEKLQQETLKRFIGMEEEVLAEAVSKRSELALSGRGRHGVSVTLPGNHAEIGTVLKCRITGVKNNTLTAERTDQA